MASCMRGGVIRYFPQTVINDVLPVLVPSINAANKMASPAIDVFSRDSNSGGPGGRPASLASRFDSIPTHFPLNLDAI